MKTLEDLIKVLPEFFYIYDFFTTMLAFSRHKDVFQVEKQAYITPQGQYETIWKIRIIYSSKR